MRLVRSRHGWLLLAIMALALYLRLATVRFGLPALNDPDELMFELGALRMLRGPTLDPGWFGHPATTTMYVLALINAGVFLFGYATGRFATPRQFGELVYTDPSWMILPGRLAMIVFALGTIWLVWRLATRLCGRRAGLVAALLLALDPIHVTWSQIIRSDMMACFFMLLCLEACCGIAERSRWRDYASASLWLGLAIATKWPFALTSIAMPAAALLAVRTGITSGRDAIIRLAGAGIAAIAVLVIVSPYLLIDYPTVISNLQGEGQARHLGATGGDVWHNLWWYIAGPIQAGFGLIGFLLLLWGAVHLPRHRLALAVLAPTAVAFTMVLCGQHLVWERWALPLMTIGAIIAALGVEQIVQLLRDRGIARPARIAGVTLLLGAACAPLAARTWSDGRARTTDTRQLASVWARQHITPGSTVLIEHFAFDIAGEPWHFLFPLGNAGCIDAIALLHGQINYATIEQARGGHSNLDYGTVNTARASCRTDFAILTQADRYRQERRYFPREYAAYQALIASGSVEATFSPRPGEIGGPVVTILSFPPAHPAASTDHVAVR